MDRFENRDIEDLRGITREVMQAAMAPDAPSPNSGYAGGSGGAASEPEPRSFEDEDGGTLYQMFTELDSTETGACAL